MKKRFKLLDDDPEQEVSLEIVGRHLILNKAVREMTHVGWVEFPYAYKTFMFVGHNFLTDISRNMLGIALFCGRKR